MWIKTYLEVNQGTQKVLKIFKYKVSMIQPTFHSVRTTSHRQSEKKNKQILFRINKNFTKRICIKHVFGESLKARDDECLNIMQNEKYVISACIGLQS